MKRPHSLDPYQRAFWTILAWYGGFIALAFLFRMLLEWAC